MAMILQGPISSYRKMSPSIPLGIESALGFQTLWKGFGTTQTTLMRFAGLTGHRVEETHVEQGRAMESQHLWSENPKEPHERPA